MEEIKSKEAESVPAPVVQTPPAQVPGQLPAVKAEVAVKKPKVKNPVFKGITGKQSKKDKKVVVEVKSKINMTLPTGTHLAKGASVGLSQEDLDHLNKCHSEGYEEKFFE